MKKLILLALLISPIYSEKVVFPNNAYTHYCVKIVGEYECLKVIDGSTIYKKVGEEYKELNHTSTKKLVAMNIFLGGLLIVVFIVGVAIGNRK